MRKWLGADIQIALYLLSYVNWLEIGSTNQGDAYPLQKGANHLPSYIPIELLPAQKGILFEFIREDAFFGFARMLLEASRGLVLGYLGQVT